MGLDITIKKLEIIWVVTNEIIPDSKGSEVIQNKIVDDHNCSSSVAKKEFKRMCKQCGKLISYNNFSRHVNTHSDIIYKWLTCGKTFSRELDRDRHINSFHLKKEFPCDKFKKIYRYKSTLAKHQSKCNNEV